MSFLGLVLLINIVFFLSVFFTQNVLASFIIAIATLFLILLFLRQTKINSARFLLKIGQYTSPRYYYFLTACLIIFLVLEKPIGTTASLFASFFIFAYHNKLEYRISFFFALLVLFITSLLIAEKNYIAAEVTSKIAYFFLVIGVVWYIINLLINKFGKFNNYSLFND